MGSSSLTRGYFHKLLCEGISVGCFCRVFEDCSTAHSPQAPQPIRSAGVVVSRDEMRVTALRDNSGSMAAGT